MDTFAAEVKKLSSLQKRTQGPFEVVTIWGSKGAEEGKFQWVEDFSIDSKGNLLVSDALNSPGSILLSDGSLITEYAGKGKGKEHMKKLD